jgi:hypothetical protein
MPIAIMQMTSCCREGEERTSLGGRRRCGYYTTPKTRAKARVSVKYPTVAHVLVKVLKEMIFLHKQTLSHITLAVR